MPATPETTSAVRFESVRSRTRIDLNKRALGTMPSPEMMNERKR